MPQPTLYVHIFATIAPPGGHRAACIFRSLSQVAPNSCIFSHYYPRMDTSQHTAIHRNTSQHTVAHRGTSQHPAAHRAGHRKQLVASGGARTGPALWRARLRGSARAQRSSARLSARRHIAWLINNTNQNALGVSWDRTVYVVHRQFLLYKSYTADTHRLAAPA